MFTLKLFVVLLVIAVNLVVAQQYQPFCGGGPGRFVFFKLSQCISLNFCFNSKAHCRPGSHERYYDCMPTSCQRECSGGACQCAFFRCPSGNYCDEGYARLRARGDCPGPCVPINSRECRNLRRSGR